MAVKATAEITLRDQTDAEAIILWHYVSTSATKPDKPNTTSASATPSGWSKSEPSVSSDSDLSKYDYTSLQTVWGDGTCDWGDVNLSASYEAAKRAWNKAGSVENQLNNLEIGGRNLARNTADFSGWGRDSTVWTFSDGVATFVPPSTRSWKQLGQRPGAPLSLFDFDATYVISFDAMLVSGTVASGDSLSPCVALRDTADTNSRQRYRSWNIISSLTSEWQRIPKVIDPLPISSWSGTASSEAYFGVDFWLYTATATIAIRNVKLEKGNKATDWTPAPEDFALASDSVEYIAGTQTAATGSWTGVTRDSSLYVGKTIAYKLPYAGSGNASLQLKDSSGNNVGGNIAVYSMTTRVTTHYPAGSVIQMTYDGTYWRTAGWYNSNNYDRNLHNNYVKAAANVTSGQLVCGTSAGYKPIAASVTFDMSYPILWAAGAWTSGTQYANAYETYPGVNPATTATVESLGKNLMVYVKGQISGNTFTCAASNFLTCKVPTSEDGYFYLPIGIIANDATTKMYFNTSNDLYAYLDGKFRQVTPTEVVASHRVYYRTDTAKSSLAAPTSWVTEATSNVYNAWTTKIPPLAASTESGQQKYPFLYTCEQRKRLDGPIKCTGVQLDETAVVIDGGNLIAGSVTANRLNAANINASKTLTVGAMTDDDAKLILNSNVQVGGRNLFGYGSECESLDGFTLNSTWDIVTKDGFTCAHASGVLKTTKYLLSKIPFTPKPEEYVTLSAYIQINNIVQGTTNPMCEFYPSGQTLNGAWRAPSIKAIYIDGVKKESVSSGRFNNNITDTNWHHFAVVYQWPNYEFTANLMPSVYLRDCTGDLYVHHIKYERGNKATDWTPAPEDVTNDINTVSTAMSEANEGLADSIAAVSKSLEDTNTRLIDLTQAVRDADADRAKWIRADDRGLTIGAVDSDYNLVLDNNSVDFKIGDQLAATASVDAFIPTALRLGDYVLSGSGGYLYIDYQPLQTQ